MTIHTHEEYLGLRRFTALDGLRALSVMLVFTAHPAYPEFWPLFHGEAGVTIFFVLSGFLITTLLLREQDRYGKVDLTAFYIRRTFRIAPVYLLVFLVYVVLILGLGMQSEREAGFVENIPYYLLFFPEHSIAFNDWGYHIPFNGAWSIGIEEKFYFVWPVLGFVLVAAFPRTRLVLLSVLALGATVATFFGGDWMLVALYSGICYGSILAILLHHGRTYRVMSRLGKPPVLAILAAVVIAMQFGTDLIGRSKPLYGVYGIMIALLICGIVTTRTRAIGWLSARPLVYIGALSYVLYLIHNFGLNAAEMVIPLEWGLPGSLLSTALGIGVSFVVAAAIHHWYEEPLRLIGARISKQRRAIRTVPAVRESDVSAAP